MTQPDNTSMQDQAAAYALGALSPEDTRTFEAFLATSPATRRDVAEFREVGALLATAQMGAAADSSLKGRVLDRIGREKETPLRSPARRPTAVPIPVWLALAASLVLAVWLGAALVSARRDLAAREAAVDSARAALDSVQTRLAQREKTLNQYILEPGVQLSLLTTTGTAEPKIQFFWNRQKNVAMVHAFNLSPADSGRVYQLWFILDGKPVPSVTFNSEPSGHAMVEGLSVPSGSGLTHAAITIEPVGGSQLPTSPVVLIGPLQTS